MNKERTNILFSSIITSNERWKKIVVPFFFSFFIDLIKHFMFRKQYKRKGQDTKKKPNK